MGEVEVEVEVDVDVDVGNERNDCDSWTDERERRTS